MLVCSVVLRPQRHLLAAEIIEAAFALDELSLGTILAAIADNPASAQEYLDAFIGSRIPEAANASATVDAVAVHPASLVEEISAAIATQDASIGGAVILIRRDGMVGTAFVNSDGTARQANADGIMVNL